MANASVEISGVRPVGSISTEIHGRCIRQQTLAISGTTATLTGAIAAADVTDNGAIVARICTDDTGCYVARGSTPDPTATAATTATSARRWIPAGGEITIELALGDLIAVHS